MISLTVFEHQLRTQLRRLAAAADPAHPLECLTTYGALGEALDPEGSRASGSQPNTRPPFRGFNEALGHVSMYEVEHGRPMLSAIVVNKETRSPGPGFASLGRHLGFVIEEDEAFFLEQLSAVIEFWTSDDPTVAIDAALEVVMAELSAIKAIVRRSVKPSGN
jgi:hypothetical protein